MDHSTYTSLQCTSQTYFVFLWLYKKICSYYTMFSIWNGIVFLHTSFICKVDDHFLTLLYGIVDIEQCFPNFLSAEPLQCQSFLTEPQTNTKSHIYMRDTSEGLTMLKMYDICVLYVTLAWMILLSFVSLANWSGHTMKKGHTCIIHFHLLVCFTL